MRPLAWHELAVTLSIPASHRRAPSRSNAIARFRRHLYPGTTTQSFGNHICIGVVILIAEHRKAAQRRLDSPQHIGARPCVLSSGSPFSPSGRSSDEISREYHEVGLLGVGQLDHPVEMTRGHEGEKVDVTELCDAKTIKSRRKALERYSDLADDGLLRLVKTIPESPSS